MAVASSSSASVAVEKATSDLLIGPDWTMNIDICDSLNSNRWLAKDVVKAVKKRLQHKNPKVQLLALTLLETMVKNCGDYVHFQIAEKNILGEMVRIVKKKTDMHVRDKILVLLDSWQEAFGGPGGKHPQYYWAYEELRRSGVEFPQRSMDAAPIFTPPVSHLTMRHAQAGYGMPSNSSRRLDETMATEIEGLSLPSLDSMRNVMELLGDMLQAVNPDDRDAVKDEIIVDLVNRCRSNQKKLMQMLTTTGDEELLGQGLELNDSLQNLLAKHDVIASGHPMPTQVANLSLKPSEGCSSSIKQMEVKDFGSSPSSNATVTGTSTTRSHLDEEDEEEDDFAQLARRHSRPQSSPSQTKYATSDALVPVSASSATSCTSTPTPTPTASTSTPIALVLAIPDPPAPVRTTKEQDMIDLLSIALSTTSTSHQSDTPHTPPASNQSMPQAPVSSTQGNTYVSQTYPGNQGQAAFNSYVVPWAQPQPQQQLQFPSQPHSQTRIQQQLQPQPQLHPQAMSQSQPLAQQHFSSQSQPQPCSQPQPQPQPLQQFQNQFQEQPYSQPQPQQAFQIESQQLHTQQKPQAQIQPVPQQKFQPQHQQQFQQQLQPQYTQYSSNYPPPPWAATPGYANGQSHPSTTSNMFSTPQNNAAASYTPAQAPRSMQHNNSFNSRGSNALAMNGNPWASSGPRNTTPPGQKPFIPSYRLFEDLNVLGNADGRFKMNGSTSPSLSGPSSQGMVGGRK
ncbi:protein transporter, putative [Ricinus communis]|uniref:Protein transporter, putative n=1 Tax=Ricinus communis TaxID=3988 RepID=B9T6F7_RICCO|nr:protein transporter, putative [Ricinus communis]|eukprot:XP_002533826.1 TOM1-like protein 6 [Ricinus communis]